MCSTRENISKKDKTIKVIYDPRITRIEKISAKNCPKFLDLYASIYGMLKFKAVVLDHYELAAQ